MKPADELRATLRESQKPLLRFTRGHIKEYAALLDECERDLALALEYWAHRMQRYKNRHPVWVQNARATLAKLRGQT